MTLPEKCPNCGATLIYTLSVTDFSIKREATCRWCEYKVGESRPIKSQTTKEKLWKGNQV